MIQNTSALTGLIFGPTTTNY